jgi:hypothetical protein
MKTWRRFVDWCAEDEPADALAWFRIAVALTCLWTWYTPLASEAWRVFVDESHGGMARDGFGAWWWASVGGSTPSNVFALLLAAAASSVALALGVGGRWMALLSGQLAVAIFALHPGTGGGHDRLITNGLWLLFLSGAHRSWSLPVRLRTGRWRDPEARVLSWPRRMAIWQVLIMYVLTGLQKQGTAWAAEGDYRALYDTFLLPSWSKFDMTWVAHVFPVLQLSTIVAWWWESLFFLLIFWYWFRQPSWSGWRVHRWSHAWDLRVPFLALGVVTHGVLWIAMDLGPFSPMTFAFYLCFWTEADLVRWRSWRAGRAVPEGLD